MALCVKKKPGSRNIFQPTGAIMNFSLSDEQSLLVEAVKDFTRREVTARAAEWESTGRLSDDIIHHCARMGLLGMGVDTRYDGAATGCLETVLAVEQLAYSGTGLWWLTAFCDSIPECIQRYGSARQKAHYLPRICQGASIPSLQFTEDGTGSDPTALITRSTPLAEDAATITGMKRFSTFGNRDGCAIVFTLDETNACTAYLIDKNTPGYTATPNYALMGCGGIEAADVYYDSFKTAPQALFGKQGQGLEILQHWIHSEKIQQCAACVGIAQAAFDEAAAFAKSRLVHGRPQSKLQGIRWMMADMYAQLQAARQLTYRAACLKEAQASDWMTEAAAAKLFVVPSTMRITDEARRIHGSYGYTKEFKIERLYRAIAGASAIAVSLEINKSIVGAAVLK